MRSHQKYSLLHPLRPTHRAPCSRCAHTAVWSSPHGSERQRAAARCAGAQKAGESSGKQQTGCLAGWQTGYLWPLCRRGEGGWCLELDLGENVGWTTPAGELRWEEQRSVGLGKSNLLCSLHHRQHPAPELLQLSSHLKEKWSDTNEERLLLLSKEDIVHVGH